MIHITDVLDFKVLIHRKSIKNIYLRVDSSDGSVKVSAPKRMSITAVKTYIMECEHWIRRQQFEQLKHHALRPYHHLVTGEHIPLWGELYPLEVKTQSPVNRVELKPDRIAMYERGRGSKKGRLKKIDAWYRDQLLEAGVRLIRHWEPIIGVSIDALTIRRMLTLWGSCNIQRSRICVNRELVKLHRDCLEGVIVHEMTHLHERHHNKRFYHLMSHYLPDWRSRDARLNASIKAMGGLSRQD